MLQAKWSGGDTQGGWAFAAEYMCMYQPIQLGRPDRPPQHSLTKARLTVVSPAGLEKLRPSCVFADGCERRLGSATPSMLL